MSKINNEYPIKLDTCTYCIDSLRLDSNSDKETHVMALKGTDGLWMLLLVAAGGVIDTTNHRSIPNKFDTMEQAVEFYKINGVQKFLLN